MSQWPFWLYEPPSCLPDERRSTPRTAGQAHGTGGGGQGHLASRERPPTPYQTTMLFTAAFLNLFH